MSRMPVEERFWSKVDYSGECWLWEAHLDRAGYGTFSYKGRAQAVHRVAWMLVNGPIPDGMYVCHRCTVRNCVRPEHLYLETRVGNMLTHPEWTARGERHKSVTHPESVPRGENHPWAVLTNAQVAEMRRFYRCGLSTPTGLARLFAISRQNVWLIVHGKTWQSQSLTGSVPCALEEGLRC